MKAYVLKIIRLELAGTRWSNFCNYWW